MVADIAAVLVGGVVATMLQWLFLPVPRFIVREHIELLMFSLPLFVLGAVVSDLYKSRANERPSEEWGNIVKAVGVLRRRAGLARPSSFSTAGCRGSG